MSTHHIATAVNRVAAAVKSAAVSSAEKNADGGSANLTDGLFALSRSVDNVAKELREANGGRLR